MGVINPENTLQFRSTIELFSRVKETLHSYDAQNLIDEGSFYRDVAYILDKFGAAVYKECEAVIEVKDHIAKLPCNFKLWHSAYKCHRHNGGTTPDINLQDNFGQPWIYFTDAELTKECNNRCKISCCHDEGRFRVVVRTFVNGGEHECHFHDPEPLVLSPNVKDRCAPHCMQFRNVGWNEVTIDHDSCLRTKFRQGEIYMQYYGLPIDDNFLPLIPDQSSIELAIEYYIYKMLFERWYFNSTVPDIVQKLVYVNQQFDYYYKDALQWVKTPSFQKCIQQIRVIKNNNKFYQFNFDKTRVGSYWSGWGWNSFWGR